MHAPFVELDDLDPALEELDEVTWSPPTAPSAVKSREAMEELQDEVIMVEKRTSSQRYHGGAWKKKKRPSCSLLTPPMQIYAVTRLPFNA